MPDDNPRARAALIRLHIDRQLKNRWVRHAQNDGLRLHQWIIETLERATAPNPWEDNRQNPGDRNTPSEGERSRHPGGRNTPKRRP